MIEILLAAMMMVESGGRCDVVGDGGRSIGPLQIQYCYWRDSGVPGKYQDCKQPEYAKRVVRAYWKRYCPNALKRGDLQTLARVHNGGPSGANPKYVKRYAATSRYWRKVKRMMK
jgi:hypothetical protein